MQTYRYETHMHTLEGSACAHNTGAEMAAAYSSAGYAGIVVTNHFYYGNTAVDRRLPWEAWVEEFCKGYENARTEGEKTGLSVFFGWESNYKGTEFLIYGPDKDWLMKHPEIRDASIEEQLKLVHEAGGIVVHAHPFRKESYIPSVRLFPELVDGVEAVNATHSSPRSISHKDPEFNKKAEDYARKNGLFMTAGSDGHNTIMLGGGMEFARECRDIWELIQAMKESLAVRLLDGSELS